MSSRHSWYRLSSFSEREALAMRLLFDRPAGNRFPDTDRTVSSLSTGGRTIVCY